MSQAVAGDGDEETVAGGQMVEQAVPGSSACPAEADQAAGDPPSDTQDGTAAMASAASARASCCSSSPMHCAHPPTAEDQETEAVEAASARPEAADLQELLAAVPAAAPSPWQPQSAADGSPAGSGSSSMDTSAHCAQPLVSPAASRGARAAY